MINPIRKDILLREIIQIEETIMKDQDADLDPIPNPLKDHEGTIKIDKGRDHMIDKDMDLPKETTPITIVILKTNRLNSSNNNNNNPQQI